MVRDLEQQLRHYDGAAHRRLYKLDEEMKKTKTLDKVCFNDNMCKTTCHTYI